MTTASFGARFNRAPWFLAVALATVFTTTSPSRAATVTWTGPNNFNDASITFAPITANQLTSVTGDGRYEGCCSGFFTLHPLTFHPAVPTTFSILLEEGAGNWVQISSWNYTPDEISKSLSSLFPPAITFPKVTFTRIELFSTPAGSPSSDFNFTKFNFVTIKCGDDDEHEYGGYGDDDGRCKIKTHHTVFNFDCVECVTDPGPGSGPATTPLPAAAWLFGSVIAGGAGFGRWRKRRKAAA